jgi:hypothetical protein
MKLEDARGHYYFYSGKVSDIVRQLGFVGLAIIWFFRLDANGTQTIQSELLPVTVLIVLGLAFDFFQYSYAAIAWGIYSRLKEKKNIIEFEASQKINWATIFFFGSKTLMIGLAYILLLRFLVCKLF